MVAIPVPTQRPAVLDILSIGSFRRLWLSNGFTYMGLRVREMAFAWLVLEMTGVNMWAGIVNGLPVFSVILFSLVGGVLSDRADRRTVLAWTRLTMAALMFLTAFLVTTGAISLWQVVLVSLVGGGVYAMDLPISRALIFDQVGKERLLRATSLNSTLMDIGAIAGPWVAGMLIADVGVEAALYLIGVTYTVAFAVLFFNRPPRRPVATERKATPVRTLFEGFAYIRRTPGVPRIVSLSATVPLAGVFFSMLPIYARDILDVGAGGLGLMVAAYGIGALVGSVVMTAKGEISRLGVAVGVSAAVYGVAMMLFALTPTFEVALTAMFVSGIASTFWKNSSSSLLQVSVAGEVRGRVMSVYGMGAQLPFGWLVGGLLSALIGNVATLLLAGVAMIALNAWVCAGTCRWDASRAARS